MGRRIRSLPSVDRAEFNGEPLGLQCHGSHHFDRRLFAVHLFHSAESGVKAIANTQRSLTPGDRSGPDDRISSGTTELPRDRVRSPWQLARYDHAQHDVEQSPADVLSFWGGLPPASTLAQVALYGESHGTDDFEIFCR